MKKSNQLKGVILIGLSLLLVSCETKEEEESVGNEIYTANIMTESQLFSFQSGDFVSTYDLVFALSNGSYVVQLNSAAGVEAIVDTSTDFDTATIPDTNYQYDTTGYYVIGDSWMDVTTYNPTDHSIQGNGNVYFLWSADYEWVKLSVLSGSPTQFSIQYAIEQEDGSFGNTQIVTIPYSEDSPAYFDFTAGKVIEPEEWDIGFVAIPVYLPGAGLFYMPTVHLNYNLAVQVAIIMDQNFKDIVDLPENVTWLGDSGNLRQLGYGESYEVLLYDPTIHKVSVEHPEYVYLIETGSVFYKLQFLEYNSGVLLFKYAKL